MNAIPRLRQEITQILDAMQPQDEIQKIRLESLQSSIFKKYLGSQAQEDVLHLQALERFRATCLRLKTVNMLSFPERLVRYMKADIAHAMQQAPYLTFSYMAAYGKTGPGKSIGSAETDDFMNKMFISDLAATSTYLQETYRSHLSGRWLSAELFRAKRHSTKVVQGSKITTVPKDESKRRCICVEPSLNMFFQLGAKVWFEDVLRKGHNIDLARQQSTNRKMARIGSINQSFATIDLTDASDSISTSLVSALLPHEILWKLDRIRCSESRVGQEWITLPMFSTMGCGFTFGLMTLIFSALVRAVYNINGIHPRNGVNYAVNGDDIIVINNLFPQVIHALESLGFLPNEDKSFSEGFFRESCGGDYFHGYNVRGVYCKRIRHETDLYSLCNRLVRWSCSSGIDISAILDLITRELPKDKILRVPFDEPDTAGIKVPKELASDLLKNGVWRYKRFIPVKRVRGVRKIARTYPDGAITAFIGGYVRGDLINLRAENPRYKVSEALTPAWERRVCVDPNEIAQLLSYYEEQGQVHFSKVRRANRDQLDFDCWHHHDDQAAYELLTQVLTGR